uniref:DEK-C domain-containing protein n=1 Tax=Rhodosorus marinus TaxID=101924 RepID=A0A7S3EHS5_9RHOD|mmetsp:Transcript_33530/g.132230  ORF Transcript_33530/g.132230 Transcript_33530/m.132230 type:complete len:253 (+) Transcript_33530:177-935(+)
MGSVSDEELTGALEEILTEADLEATTVRTVMQQLASRFPNDNLEGKNNFIRVELARLVDTIEERKEAKEEPEEGSLEEEEEDVVEEEAAESSGSEVVIEEIEEEAEEEELEEEEEVEDSPKPAKRRKLTAFEKAVVLKDPLAEALGVRVVSRCKLPQHVKAYIEKHGLEKNPKDRREYLSDDTMRKVLKTKSFSMFSINKYMAPLILKPDECDEETQEEARAYEAKVLAALPATSRNGESKAAKKRKKAKGM